MWYDVHQEQESTRRVVRVEMVSTLLLLSDHFTLIVTESLTAVCWLLPIKLAV